MDLNYFLLLSSRENSRDLFTFYWKKILTTTMSLITFYSLVFVATIII